MKMLFQKQIKITIVLALSIFLSGCFTLTGVVTGPITGTISCAKGFSDDSRKDKSAIWGVIFSPIIGTVAAISSGISNDIDVILGRRASLEDVIDPCDSDFNRGPSPLTPLKK